MLYYNSTTVRQRILRKNNKHLIERYRIKMIQ